MSIDEKTSHTLSSSLCSYLCAVYYIGEKNTKIRTKDIASFLRVKPSSVTAALQRSAKKNLLVYQPYREVHLTASGHVFVRNALHRQRALFEFFIKVLHLDENESMRMAMKLSDHLSPLAIIRMVSLSRGLLEEKQAFSFESFDVSCERGKYCRYCQKNLSVVPS